MPWYGASISIFQKRLMLQFRSEGVIDLNTNVDRHLTENIKMETSYQIINKHHLDLSMRETLNLNLNLY